MSGVNSINWSRIAVQIVYYFFSYFKIAKENEKIKGIRICRQAKANWEEEFDERKDPNGRTYYWLTGKFVNYDKGGDTDERALENHFVSVVPVQYDVTAHHAISVLNNIIENE